MTVPHALLSELTASDSAVDARLDTVEGDVATVEGDVATIAAKVVEIIGPPVASATTNRTLVQAALDAASPGDVVRLQPNSIYEVNQAGTAVTPSHGGTLYRYCLMIPTGVTLDLNGSTLKLAAGVAASVVRGPVAGGAGIGLVGYGTIDGSGNSTADSASGYSVWFDGISDLALDVKINNAVLGAVVLEACTKVKAPRVVIDTCVGIGIGCGNGAAQVVDAWFGYIDIRNITEWSPNVVNFPGNTIAGSAVNCRMDTVIVRNSGAAIKVDAGSVDWTFGHVYGDTVGAGAAPTNSGLKFQGTGTGTPLRCHAEHVHMKSQAGMGLFMDQCTDCSVGTYIGEGNNTIGTVADVWVGGTRDVIGQLRSTGSKASVILIRTTAVDYRIGIADIRNPAVAANGIADSGGSGAIGQLIALDDRGGGALMDRGYRSNSANSVCHIGYADVRGATVQPIQRTAGDKVTVGMLRSNATVALDSQTLSADAAFTLTPGASPVQTFHTATLTADRALTLSATGAYPGAEFVVTRTGGGAFNITNALKNIATGQWARFRYDGAAAAWKLVAFGSL